MAFPESWTCPVCGATVTNSSKCNVCAYHPPSESGSLTVQHKQASLLKERILAFLIDCGFIMGLGLLLSVGLAVGLSLQYGKGLDVLVPLFSIPVIIFLVIFHPVYFIILEGRYSSTYGKKLMKLTVACNEGSIGFKRSLIRNGARFIEALTLYIMSVVMIKSNNERWGDRLAGTRVVRKV